MLGKKIPKRLVDLECMIPKEHKVQAGIASQQPQVEVPEQEPEPPRFRESCHACSRTSDEVVLTPVFHQGSDRWMCPRCLKRAIEDDSPTYYSSETAYAEKPQNEEYQTSTETSTSNESTDPDYGGVMSMFD